MHIYIEGLPFDISEAGLQRLFEQFGKVQFVSVLKERLTRRSKGIGYVEMPDEDQAAKAIAALNGKLMNGKKLRVKVSPRPSPVAGDKG